MEHKPARQLTERKNILIDVDIQGTQETALPASLEQREKSKQKNSLLKDHPTNADLEMY